MQAAGGVATKAAEQKRRNTAGGGTTTAAEQKGRKQAGKGDGAKEPTGQKDRDKRAVEDCPDGPDRAKKSGEQHSLFSA